MHEYKLEAGYRQTELEHILHFEGLPSWHDGMRPIPQLHECESHFVWAADW